MIYEPDPIVMCHGHDGNSKEYCSLAEKFRKINCTTIAPAPSETYGTPLSHVQTHKKLNVLPIIVCIRGNSIYQKLQLIVAQYYIIEQCREKLYFVTCEQQIKTQTSCADWSAMFVVRSL